MNHVQKSISLFGTLLLLGAGCLGNASVEQKTDASVGSEVTTEEGAYPEDADQTQNAEGTTTGTDASLNAETTLDASLNLSAPAKADASAKTTVNVGAKAGADSKKTEGTLTQEVSGDLKTDAAASSNGASSKPVSGTSETPTQETKSEAEPTPAPSPTPAPAPEPTPEPESTPAPPADVTVNMTAKQWEFIPNTVKVKQGQKVILNITSTDLDHGISLAAFGVSDTLVSGKTTTVSFVADKVGSFGFFCSVFCGAGHGGMTGTVVVE